MSLHALLSASSAHRWLNCTAAPRLEATIPDSSSMYAAEGTLAHAIGEKILLGEDYKLLTKDELYYQGMVDEVEDYTSYVLERFNEAKATDKYAALYVEQKLDLSEWIPEGFGTGDAVIIGNGLLEVVDLKFGKGVDVDPVYNPQFMLYGLGSLKEFGYLYDIDKVRLTCAQVRTNGISSFEISVAELTKWGEDVVKPTAEIAFKGGDDPTPGSWCGFCRFRSMCKKRAEYNLGLVDKYKGRELTLEDVSEILAKSKEINSWLSDIETKALEDALQGVSIPGWKVVEGRSNRKIVDEEGLAEVLLKDFEEEKIYKPKALQTITNLEKLVGKKTFENISKGYIEKPQGKPTLVVETDKRPAIAGVEDEFEFN